MTEYPAHEYYNQYIELQHQLKLYQTKLQMILTRVPEVTLIQQKRPPAKINPNIKRYVELSAEYERLKLKAEEKCLEILAEIDRHPRYKERIILRMYYIEGKTLKEISRKIHLSYIHTYRLYRRALEKMIKNDK